MGGSIIPDPSDKSIEPLVVSPIDYHGGKSDIHYYNTDGLIKYRCMRMKDNAITTENHKIWKYSYTSAGLVERITGPLVGPANSEVVINSMGWAF